MFNRITTLSETVIGGKTRDETGQTQHRLDASRPSCLFEILQSSPLAQLPQAAYLLH